MEHQPTYVIVWGDYASERGIAFSNPSGLSIWACAYNASCSMNGQGNRPCGRSLLGPFSWGHMGDNTDLNPKNSSAWGAVWLRTNASMVSTTFADVGSTAEPRVATLASSASVSMFVEVLGADLGVKALLPCTTRWNSAADRSVVVHCDVGHPGSEKHLGLRFAGAKLRKGHDHREAGVGLLQTSFA